MKKFTQLMAASALLIGGSFAANAQVVQIQENPLADGIVKARITNAENYETREVEGGKILTPKRARTQAPAEETTITAKISHNYNTDEYEIYYTLITDFNTGEEYWLYNNDSIANIPAGTYDVIVSYKQLKYIYDDGATNDNVYRCFVSEQVEFNEGTVLETSPDNTYNGPIVQAVNPEGEVLRQPTVKIYEDGTEEVIDEGNYLDMYVFNGIVHKESGATIGIIGGNTSSIWQKPTGTEKYNESVNRINVSPLSDRFALYTVRFYYTKSADCFYYIYLQGDYTENGIMTNNPEDYALYEEYIAQSPKGKETMGSNSFPFISIGGFEESGANLSGWEIFLQKALPENKIKYYVNNIVEGEKHIVPLFQGGFIDGQGQDFIGRPTYENCQVYTPYLMQESDGSINYVNNGDFAMFNRIPNEKGSLDWTPVYPGNPLLSYTTTEKEYTLNNCCPIQLPEYLDYMAWYNCYYLYFNRHLGRIGEKNLFNNNMPIIKMTADGELVKEVSGQYNIDWVPADYEGKIVEFISTNDNVSVDGSISGKNTTTVHIDYTQTDDHTAPSLTMLDFVNAEGIMTDRFNTPQDGTIRIYAGDFNVAMTELDYQYADCSESLANIEVYYAPYNTDTWETITVEEDPDQFYLPGYGQFFSGSLADVNKVADNGWCDVKIKITDAAGNFQEQIISPAFYIEDVSAIESITSDSDATIVGYYDILGRKLNEPADGINIVRMSDGTAKKVVIEKK